MCPRNRFKLFFNKNTSSKCDNTFVQRLVPQRKSIQYEAQIYCCSSAKDQRTQKWWAWLCQSGQALPTWSVYFLIQEPIKSPQKESVPFFQPARLIIKSSLAWRQCILYVALWPSIQSRLIRIWEWMSREGEAVLVWSIVPRFQALLVIKHPTAFKRLAPQLDRIPYQHFCSRIRYVLFVTAKT